jgi:hypothetical protein
MVLALVAGITAGLEASGLLNQLAKHGRSVYISRQRGVRSNSAYCVGQIKYLAVTGNCIPCVRLLPFQNYLDRVCAVTGCCAGCCVS